MPRLMFVLAIILSTNLLGIHASYAAEGLLVTPNRVIFEGRDREAQVTLTNSGTDEGEFKLYFVNYRMTESGQFEPITTSTSPTGELFSDKLIRFSPRRVVLPPGTTQIARLQLRLPAGLAPGEYRSHLVFQSIPKKSVTREIKKSEGKASAAITTLYGLSIPIIVRVGTKPSNVKIEEPAIVMEDGKPVLQMILNRTGAESVYGDITVQLQNGKEPPKTIGESIGLAVYTPAAERKVKIPLSTDSNFPWKGSKLSISYRDTFKGQRLLAVKEIELR